MPRKRTDLSAHQEAHLVALMTRGGTVESNTAALQAAGVKVSPATVGRRMRELRGTVNATRAANRAARTPSHRSAPTALPAHQTPPAPPGSLIAGILRAWCEEQDDPEEALELVYADLAASADALQPEEAP